MLRDPSDTVIHAPGAFNLEDAQSAARSIAAGARVLDLSRIGHDRSRHADMLALSALAWWLMSTELDIESLTVKTPAVTNGAWLPLVRSGLITAAQLRDVAIATPDGGRLAASATAQDRLPGADWAVLDPAREGRSAGGELLRVIPDLTDPSRAVKRVTDARYAFPWLTKMGLASPAIDSRDYPRFLADADMVIAELIDNVHRWSRAGRGLAVVSTTRGSARKSWNRLHIVIADDGVGIATALSEDREALRAVRDVGGQHDRSTDASDGELVELLMRYAFGARQIPNHNGHGLHVAQVRAGRWVGVLDIVTIDRSGTPLRRSSQGVNPILFDSDDALELPGSRGTLAHLLLQATSGPYREDAAEYEQLAIQPWTEPAAASAGR